MKQTLPGSQTDSRKGLCVYSVAGVSLTSSPSSHPISAGTIDFSFALPFVHLFHSW